MNVTNDNAVQLLLLLRQEPYTDAGLVGTISNLAGFIEACDSVLETMRSFSSLDSGTPPTETGGAGGCRMIRCGIPAHYLQRRVSELRALAETAISVEGVINYA